MTRENTSRDVPIEPDDEVLVRAAKQNRAAFTPLYRRYAERVYRYVYSRVGDAAEAEDLVAQAISPAVDEFPLSLDQVVTTQDGYIFIGKFRQVLPVLVTQISPQIRDANGLLQGYSIPGDVVLSSSIEPAIEWAYQLREKEIAWPVTIRFDSVVGACPTPSAPFSFDPGPDPQDGQVWQVQQTIAAGPCSLKVNTIQRTSSGYLLRLDAPADLRQINLEVAGTTPAKIDSRLFPDRFEVRILYDQEPPKGPLSISFSVYVALDGSWQVQWQPNQK